MIDNLTRLGAQGLWDYGSLAAIRGNEKGMSAQFISGEQERSIYQSISHDSLGQINIISRKFLVQKRGFSQS